MPMKQAARIASIGFMPLTIRLPIRALESASRLPTDRSMPPVRMTKVIPKEIRALMET